MRIDGKYTPERVSKDQLKQLLTRGWMTHDGMWFHQCLAEVGIETTNRLNKAAIRAMAGLEVKRLKAALGVEAIADMGQLQAFLVDALSLVVGDYMVFEWEWTATGMRMDMERCFAHQGAVMMGVADRYECGIYGRIFAWLDALGIAHRSSPALGLCQMQHTGRCQREINFDLPPAA